MAFLASTFVKAQIFALLLSCAFAARAADYSCLCAVAHLCSLLQYATVLDVVLLLGADLMIAADLTRSLCSHIAHDSV